MLMIFLKQGKKPLKRQFSLFPGVVAGRAGV
jgi:hypothetical protein